MIKKIISIIPILFLLMLQITGAKVLSSVDRTEVAEGESLTLTITLDNVNEQPDLTPLKNNFDIYGTSTSSQTSIFNGKTTSDISYVVTLLPKVVGSVEIPALTVGKEQTNSVMITVTKSVIGTGAQQTAKIFSVASTAVDSAYINTPVLYTLKLYYAEPVSNLSMQPLQLIHATIESFGQNSQYQAQYEGKSYNVVEQQFLITANKSGELEIPQSIIQAAVLQNNPNSFFAMQTAKPILIKSNALTLTIKAIPQNIDINDWLPANLVTLKDSWSTTSNELMVGEPLTRTVTLTATGIQAANLPNLMFPVDSRVNVYPDKVQSKDFIEQSLPVATKVFKVAYIPTQKGVVEFPAVKVHWFDVKSQTEKTEILPARTFKILPGKMHAPVAISNVTAATPTETVVKVVQSKLSLIVAIIFAVLWLITLILLLICLVKVKRKKADKELKSKKVAPPAKPDMSKVLSAVKSACDKQNLADLNQAIIQWGNVLFKQKIYSVMDILKFIEDDTLKTNLKVLNEALYATGEFSAYAAFYQALSQYKKSSALINDKGLLKSLYP